MKAMKKKSNEALENGIQIATRNWVVSNTAKMIEEKYSDFSNVANSINFKNVEMICEAYEGVSERINEVEKRVDVALSNPFFTNLPSMIEQIKFCDLGFIGAQWFNEFAPVQHGHDASTVFIKGQSLVEILNGKSDKVHKHPEYLTEEDAERKFISIESVEALDFSDDIDEWYSIKKNTIISEVKNNIKKDETECEVIQQNVKTYEVNINLTSTSKDIFVKCNQDLPTELHFTLAVDNNKVNFSNEFIVSIPEVGEQQMTLFINTSDSKRKDKVFLDWNHEEGEIINSPACEFRFHFINDCWFISRKLYQAHL